MKSSMDSSQNPKSTAEILPDDHDLQSNGQDDEETLSLRDLPITVYSDHHTAIKTNHSRSSSSDSIFEFSTSDVTSSNADDVILDGHILPYAPPPPRLPRRSLSLSSAATWSESDTKSAVNRSEFRPSRSLKCRKLRRSEGNAKAEDTASLLYSRSLSSSCRSINSPWYHWLIFGLPVRIPGEIELKDIKNRQSRRRIPLYSGDRSSNSLSSTTWRVLSVLSCKNHSSVDVTNTASIFR